MSVYQVKPLTRAERMLLGRASEILPSRTAMHEAAHALVRITRGRRIEFVALVSDDPDCRGVCQSADMLADWRGARGPQWLWGEEELLADEEDVLTEVATTVAGEVAEVLAFGSADEDWLGRDREGMGHIRHLIDAGDANWDGIVNAAYAEAERILRDRDGWSALVGLARALERRKRLTHDEAADVIDRNTPRRVRVVQREPKETPAEVVRVGRQEE